jgi:uncharacterized protein YerC
VPELQALSQRLQVAKMLSEHKIYSEIVRATGASTATISRVKKCLHYGADGYRQILDRCAAPEGNAAKDEKDKKQIKTAKPIKMR